jgi:HEAT repeat protein
MDLRGGVWSIWVLLAGGTVVASPAADSAAPPQSRPPPDVAAPICVDRDDCVRALIAAAGQPGPYEGITEREEAVAERMLALGPECVPALIELLACDEPGVRAAAEFALGEFKAAARPARPALERALRRGDGWAAYALGWLGDPAVIPVLREAAVRGELAASRYRGSGASEPERKKLRRQLGLTIADIPSRPYLGFKWRSRG